MHKLVRAHPRLAFHPRPKVERLPARQGRMRSPHPVLRSGPAPPALALSPKFWGQCRSECRGPPTSPDPSTLAQGVCRQAERPWAPRLGHANADLARGKAYGKRTPVPAQSLLSHAPWKLACHPSVPVAPPPSWPPASPATLRIGACARRRKRGQCGQSRASVSGAPRLACDRAANAARPGSRRTKSGSKQASTPWRWRTPPNPRFRLPHTLPQRGRPRIGKARPSPTASASDDHSRGNAHSRQLIAVLDVPYPIAMLPLARQPVETLTCESCSCESAALRSAFLSLSGTRDHLPCHLALA